MAFYSNYFASSRTSKTWACHVVRWSGKCQDSAKRQLKPKFRSEKHYHSPFLSIRLSSRHCLQLPYYRLYRIRVRNKLRFWGYPPKNNERVALVTRLRQYPSCFVADSLPFLHKPVVRSLALILCIWRSMRRTIVRCLHEDPIHLHVVSAPPLLRSHLSILPYSPSRSRRRRLRPLL